MEKGRAANAMLVTANTSRKASETFPSKAVSLPGHLEEGTNDRQSLNWIKLQGILFVAFQSYFVFQLSQTLVTNGASLETQLRSFVRKRSENVRSKTTSATLISELKNFLIFSKPLPNLCNSTFAKLIVIIAF
eukprot:snap_masked-scaffold_11-processed-gene-8.2-mRNA-1 protein AED:1.00 eAED:1.00 QI:0/0/0/0/1/1/2/0/132